MIIGIVIGACAASVAFYFLMRHFIRKIFRGG